MGVVGSVVGTGLRRRGFLGRRFFRRRRIRLRRRRVRLRRFLFPWAMPWPAVAPAGIGALPRRGALLVRLTLLAAAVVHSERPTDDVPDRVVTVAVVGTLAIVGSVVRAAVPLARVRKRHRATSTADEQAGRYEACRRGDTHTRGHSVTTSRNTARTAIYGCDDCRTIRRTHLLVNRTLRFTGRETSGLGMGDSVVLRHRLTRMAEMLTR